MKLSLNKKNIKNLSENSKLIKQAQTPQVNGGAYNGGGNMSSPNNIVCLSIAVGYQFTCQCEQK